MPIPEHEVPLPVYPLLQVHSKLPLVLMQTALASHDSGASIHSLISRIDRKITQHSPHGKDETIMLHVVHTTEFHTGISFGGGK